MPADDRSGLYEAMVEAREVAGDEEGKKALANEWLTFLEGEAVKAPNPEARTVFDSHRMSAALVLDELMRVVPAIEQSEKDLPEDYNPPARLANLYRRLGRLDEALAASDRALAKVQGSRRLRVLSDRAVIHVDLGQKEAAVSTLDEAHRLREDAVRGAGPQAPDRGPGEEARRGEGEVRTGARGGADPHPVPLPVGEGIEVRVSRSSSS